MTRKSSNTIGKVSFHNDEPVGQDSLGRSKYAKALSEVAMNCETPMVVGLFGGWGTGKSSLMMQIKSQIKLNYSDSARMVWFNSWLHQFDQNLGLALVHCMCDELNLNNQVNDLLKAIGCAFGSAFLKSSFNINFSDIHNIKKAIEEEGFLVRDAHARLRLYFREIVKKAKGVKGGGGKRIVFFIDDLDRCEPSAVLALLEHLKLYLNIDGCVFILGVDKNFLKRSLSLRYKESDGIDVTSYLDKIIQLPFEVPPISQQCIKPYIDSLVSSDLKVCVDMLAEMLGDNPRQVKRFINTFQLNHLLAQSVDINGYDPRILSFFVMLQYSFPGMYQSLLEILNENDFLTKLESAISEASNSKIKKIYEGLDRKRLSCAVDYIHLTKITRLEAIEEIVRPQFAGNVRQSVGKVRLKDVALELRLSSRDILKLTRHLNIKVVSQMSSVTEEEAFLMKAYYTKFGVPEDIPKV